MFTTCMKDFKNIAVRIKTSNWTLHLKVIHNYFMWLFILLLHRLKVAELIISLKWDIGAYCILKNNQDITR